MKKVLFVLAFLASNFAMIAGGHGQNPPTPIRGSGPPPGLPVDQYLVGLFVVGMLIVLFKQRKSFI